MRAMVKRTARTHRGPRALVPTAHCRAAAVLPKDLGDFLETPVGPAVDALLTGGDLDADWHRAWDSGDEAVGGSTAMPDQDIVDEIGRALGVEQESDAEVLTSGEILGERDRHRWDQED
jgi:Family of unknown function (DUF6335)